MESPVVFIAKWDGLPEDAELAGYTTPGWYFWTEDWATCCGPFTTEDEATIALSEYCEQLEGGK